MDDPAKRPDDCTTMSDVRIGVDQLDQQLMDLLQTRFGYMRAAARIKSERSAVRDEARKAEVIEAVRKRAEKDGLPDAKIAQIWELLVESSIEYELIEWDNLRDQS